MSLLSTYLQLQLPRKVEEDVFADRASVVIALLAFG